MKVILLQADETIGELDLSQGAYTVGRDDECSVVVDDPSLAATHARLFEEEGAAYIEPVEGETEVNGCGVSERTALADSDQISFGSIELSVSIPAILPPLPEDSPEPPDVDSSENAERLAHELAKDSWVWPKHQPVRSAVVSSWPDSRRR